LLLTKDLFSDGTMFNNKCSTNIVSSKYHHKGFLLLTKDLFSDGTMFNNKCSTNIVSSKYHHKGFLF
jgi:hypothetical protein